MSSLGPHNIVFGKNGSGKTSLLEAIHILGTARSFRSGRWRTQIQHGQDRYVIHGDIAPQEAARSRSIGVQRDKNGEVLLRIAGETVRSVARLADELPLLVINADSFDLLAGEPAHRRRFLDWGVFHVEHDCREARQRFQRALSQRNHLLRRGRIDPIELEGWTRDLAVYGDLVSGARERFLAALKGAFEPVLSGLAPDLESVSLAYRRGWDSSLTYGEALNRSLPSDREQGFTQTGPQRADVRVSVGGYPAADTLSRGQQKLVVAALKLAQGRLLAAQGAEVLFLIDDLPAELDRERCERVCRLLGEMPVQSVITCVESSSISPGWLGEGHSVPMFHVEHGTVTRADDTTSA